MVSATGKNAFTQAGVEQLMSDINDRYAGANAAYDSHTNSSFRFTITADVSARDLVIEMVNEAVEDMQFARRRWYINAAGRAYMDANNNQASGTAAQLATYLRDGLLD